MKETKNDTQIIDQDLKRKIDSAQNNMKKNVLRACNRLIITSYYCVPPNYSFISATISSLTFVRIFPSKFNPGH